jgi:hypothetical protein
VTFQTGGTKSILVGRGHRLVGVDVAVVSVTFPTCRTKPILIGWHRCAGISITDGSLSLPTRRAKPIIVLGYSTSIRDGAGHANSREGGPEKDDSNSLLHRSLQLIEIRRPTSMYANTLCPTNLFFQNYASTGRATVSIGEGWPRWAVRQQVG